MGQGSVHSFPHSTIDSALPYPWSTRTPIRTMSCAGLDGSVAWLSMMGTQIEVDFNPANHWTSFHFGTIVLASYSGSNAR